MRRDIADAARRIAIARGEQNAIDARKAELENSVGLAKGRLDRKKDVEKFIEELQADAHAKRVGDFEKLLSALVMEVLPGEKPVGLDLEIERGQPSLDIVSRVAADLSEDIFEDQGGALTNIVVLGLRMIAVVRSGMRRFIVLDEPDCWIKNERVPAFYTVVKEAARKIGMQCLVISHHDTSKFAEGISVTRIHGHPENATGVIVENNPRAYKWADDEEGFRYIRLINFQGYIDQTLYLTPGVNALIGDNNIGKSAFVRAQRAIFYGGSEARDRLIRRGQNSFTVEMGLREGYILQLVRQAKKNPTWRLLGPNRAVVSDEYNTTSKQVPDWVLRDIRIGSIAGLDPHIIKQKTPIFLLDKPGSTRASVLAIGQEATHIRTMVSTYKKMCEQDSATVKTGEAEMASLLGRQARIAPALEMEGSLEELTALVSKIESGIATQSKIEGLLGRVEAQMADMQKKRKAAEALNALPSGEELLELEVGVRRAETLANLLERCERAERSIKVNRQRLDILDGLPDQAPELKYSDDIIRLGKSVKDTVANNDLLREKIAVLATLPQEAPTLRDVSAAERILVDIAKVSARIEEARKLRAAAQSAADVIEAEMNKAIDEMGHSCPLCGGDVNDASVFLDAGNRHAHHAHTEHADV